MMQFLLNIYLFVMALIVALLEIQIEGAHGWARQLPTWRPPTHHWYARWYKKFMSGKDLTGYHLLMFTLIFLIFHLPFVVGIPFTIVRWVQTLSLFFLFIVVWDFLWFVCNPHYPLKHFAKTHIFWHQKWVGRIPIDYIGGIFFSLLVLIPGMFQTNPRTLLEWWITNVLLFGVQILIVIIVTLRFLGIDHWHHHADSSQK